MTWITFLKGDGFKSGNDISPKGVDRIVCVCVCVYLCTSLRQVSSSTHSLPNPIFYEMPRLVKYLSTIRMRVHEEHLALLG